MSERPAARLTAEDAGVVRTRLGYDLRFCEFRDGPTPAGGVRSVACWRDGDGNAVPRAEAVAAEVHELNERGDVIARTYSRVR